MRTGSYVLPKNNRSRAAAVDTSPASDEVGQLPIKARGAYQSEKSESVAPAEVDRGKATQTSAMKAT
jgi:hypothetical protein